MSQVRHAVARPPRSRRPRPLTEEQFRKRLQAAQDEVATLGGAWEMPVGRLRYRLLLLERQIQQMLERWPEDLSGYGPTTRYRRRRTAEPSNNFWAAAAQVRAHRTV